ncbi:MAG: FkbM family methyltransferase [Acidilobus sp.]
MPSLTKAKEEVLIALSVRRLIERGWLTALLGFLIKREELSVRLKYIGDVRLRWKTFGALAISTYYAIKYASKCWPKLPEDLAKTGRLFKPQEDPLWLVTALSLASYACRLQASGNRVSIDVSPERVGLAVNGVSVAFNPSCVNFGSLIEIFIEGEYDVSEVLSGLKGKEVVDVGASVGDSALYFLLNGARKVIAVEPLPKVARCAEENVRLSGATDKVKVLNAALSSGPTSVPCDYDVFSSGAFSTLKGSGPCRVPGVTLDDLLDMIDDPYLLKIDCEGCEAQVILGPERERLRAFEHIILETHPHNTGVSDEKLLASLKELGFECRLHMTHDPKLGVNIYHCKNSKLRQLNRTF